MPNGTAEVRNILSSHMTGVECPNPSNFVFHNIFFSSDHSVGGFDVSGAVPFPVLPLHDGPPARWLHVGGELLQRLAGRDVDGLRGELSTSQRRLHAV